MSALSVKTLLMVKILAETGAVVGITNPLWRRRRIPVGDTEASCLMYTAGFDRRNSQLFFEIVEVVIGMAHHLADPTVEATYLTNSMLTHQAILMDYDFYMVAGVRQVIDLPALSPPERIGNVIEYSVTTQLVLSP
jgi:hypothetical protein